MVVPLLDLNVIDCHEMCHTWFQMWLVSMTYHMALFLTKLEIFLVLLKLVFVHTTNYLWYIFDNTVTFNYNWAIIYFLILIFCYVKLLVLLYSFYNAHTYYRV